MAGNRGWLGSALAGVALALAGCSGGSGGSDSAPAASSATPVDDTPGVVIPVNDPGSVTAGPGLNPGSGGAPPAGGGSNGSPYWYEGDQFGNPYKSHSGSEAAQVAEVLRLVNQERQSRGLSPLAHDSEAETAAKVHAEDMEGRNYFSHVSPEGWRVGDRLQMTGASGYRGWSENIAVAQPNAAVAMADWMASPRHRANILDPSHTQIGIGFNEDVRVWVQVFLIR